MKSTLIATIILAASFSANATSSKDCWNNAQSTMDMNQCAINDYQAAAKKLSKATVKLTTILTKVQANDRGAAMLLVAVNNSAKNFESAAGDECTINSEMLGGTAMTAEVMGCQTREMKKRATKFNALSRQYLQQED